MLNKSASQAKALLYFVLLVTSPTLLYAQTTYNYTLGVGDEIKITVFNQEDLTDKYIIDGSGDLSLPLIGTIKAKGLSLKELEEQIINSLKPDYLINPKVSIQVLNYRPFYILGEVERPNSYPYVNGMTYLNAVAIAGGFTYRAKEDRAFVVHGDGHDSEQKEIQVKLDQLVMPGDIIRIDERFF